MPPRRSSVEAASLPLIARLPPSNHRLQDSHSASSSRRDVTSSKRWAKGPALFDPHDNEGALFNFNRVFELSTGDYFKWASHDDWISPRFIEDCFAEAERDPSTVLVYGQMCRIDAQANTRVMVVEPTPIARSTSAALRLHESLWRLPYYPIFGIFRSSAFRQTHWLTNKPEPDRVLLAEVALQGRYAQVPPVTLF